MAFLNRDPDRKALAAIQALATRRDELLSRLADAVARADAAAAEQRRILVETDTADAAALRKAGDACRRAADEHASLEDAARHVGQKLADAQAGLDAQRDRRAREGAAGEIEAGAGRIEAAAAELAYRARDLDAARTAFVSAVEADAPRDPVTGFAPTYPTVRAAGHMAGVWPLHDVDRHVGLADEVSSAVAPILAGMRAKAAAIRTGSGALVAAPSLPTYAGPALFPEVVIALIRPAFYRTHLGISVDVPAGGVTLPEPIAARAFELGVGFAATSQEGRDIVRLIRQQPAGTLQRGDDGRIRSVAFTGYLGEDTHGPIKRGVGLPPQPPPTDLGRLPDAFGVLLPEAAQ